MEPNYEASIRLMMSHLAQEYVKTRTLSERDILKLLSVIEALLALERPDSLKAAYQVLTS